MSDHTRGELPSTAAQIALTRDRDYLYSRVAQAQRGQALATTDDEQLAADRAEEKAWDEYADECARLEQCTMPGCYAHSPHRAYCLVHDDNPPDYGEE